MLVIAGLSLKNLQPRVWDHRSPYYIRQLKSIMVSYADFHAMPTRRKKAMDEGLHKYLGAPSSIKIYLDNGAFFFLRRSGRRPRKAYEEFVQQAKPDWYPIPEEYIPIPAMTYTEQQRCYKRTMNINKKFTHDGFVPVIHVGRHLRDYIQEVLSDDKMFNKSSLALGALVPNLLRAPKAIPYHKVLESLFTAREAFKQKQLHVFGIGGTATVHLAGIIGFDSIDSSGWRNRGARGIIQLAGKGDRIVAQLGNWRGRRLSTSETGMIERCRCPVCKKQHLAGLEKKGVEGFCNRATHNLWVLLEEAKWVTKRLKAGTYIHNYRKRLDNSTYLPLIERALEIKNKRK